jgi:hypothetical protein
MFPTRTPGPPKTLLRGALNFVALFAVVLLALRLSSPGPVPWFYDWPAVAAVLVVALLAVRVVGRFGLPEGATRPHWADSSALHEATQALDRDLEAEPKAPDGLPMTDAELRSRLEELSRRPDRAQAIAESEALLRQQLDHRLQPVFEADRIRRRGRRVRTRAANLVIVLLLGAGLGWMLFTVYFQ